MKWNIAVVWACLFITGGVLLVKEMKQTFQNGKLSYSLLDVPGINVMW